MSGVARWIMSSCMMQACAIKEMVQPCLIYLRVISLGARWIM